MTPFYTLLGLVVLVAVSVAVMYNRFVSQRNLVAESWQQVDVELQRRYDLIPNLVATVKAYAAHEARVLSGVTAARTEAGAAQGKALEQRQVAEGVLGQAVGSLLAVAENYPELQADANFLHLQRELSDTEDRIAAGRRFYNGNVRALNTRVESVPSNLIASTFHFGTAEYFELYEQAPRDPINVIL